MTADAPLSFEIEQRSSACSARVGRVTTPSGSFDTPAFMPVGTRASVKGLLPHLVAETGSQIILGNTYHLMLRPGSELIQELGGLHRFMGWAGPMLTDSGGYQAYSMADKSAISDDGFRFRSIISGDMIDLSPERAIEVQNQLGADIIMALDDCPPSEDPTNLSAVQFRKDAAEAAKRAGGAAYDHSKRLDEANERTIRWLERCAKAHGRPAEQALFGIVQGGTDLGRRSRSAEQVCDVELPGYAIGGVAVGEGPEDIARVVAHTAPLLPESKPRYLMGVGYEHDLLSAVRSGVDMFDCVLPTRNGRSASAFTSTGQIRLKNARFTRDQAPIEPGCDCPACDPAAHGWPTPDGRPFSRAYLRHLFLAGEMLGPILVSLHNVRHFQRLMVDIRDAIREDGWSALEQRWPVAFRSVTSEAASG